jgi:hypothetical protein
VDMSYKNSDVASTLQTMKQLELDTFLPIVHLMNSICFFGKKNSIWFDGIYLTRIL